jgi:hypothetical protein
VAELPENTGAGLATAYVPLALVACSITYDVALATGVQVSVTTSLADDKHMKLPNVFPFNALGVPGAPAAFASPGEAGDVSDQFVPVPGRPAGTMVSLPDAGDVTVPSLEVSAENVDGPSVPAGPLMSAIVMVAAVDAARAHVCPAMLVKRMTITFDNVRSTPVGVQEVENAEGEVSAMVGVIELVVKPVGNVATM